MMLYSRSAVRNVYLVDSKSSSDEEIAQSAEIIFQPERGSGEYLLYYLPHVTRYATYDGRDDVGGTTYEHHDNSFDQGVRGYRSAQNSAHVGHLRTRDSSVRDMCPEPYRAMSGTVPPRAAEHSASGDGM